MLHGIRKEDCIAHTISGTLSMEDSQSLLFITNCVLQFHSTSIDFRKHSYETKDNTYWIRLTIGVGHGQNAYCNDTNEKSIKLKSGTFGRPEKRPQDSASPFKKRDSGRKPGQMETLDMGHFF
jgi:hypothetical protein